MVVAIDIFSKDGNLIIAKDTPLTDRNIARLEFHSILELTVFGIPSSLSPAAYQQEETYIEKVKRSEAFQRFHLAYQSTTEDLKDSLNGIVHRQKKVDADQLLSDAAKIFDQCDSNTDLFHMLHCIRDYDDCTHIHCLNVALICNIIGKWLHFSSKDLEVITLCGLLHDIGKLAIPQQILLKPAKLTTDEYNTIKTHTIRGYNLLKNQPIDNRIKHAALMHHERCDGSGYPYSFLSGQIDPYAKLVAIADVYDAMTCARVYRGPLCPFEVLSIFEAEGYAKYDPKYIITFLEAIAQTYINNTVKLSNDMIGEIVLINKQNLSRPVVKVCNQFIDLSKNKDLLIKAFV
jgi:putative nucleotidyltransferase with HDIG domain